MSNRLTLNLGLRYEYTPWLTGYRSQAAAFDPTRAKPIIVSSETDDDRSRARSAWPMSGTRCSGISIQTSSQAGLPLNITKNDTQADWRRDSASPGGRSATNTVVRGGYGIVLRGRRDRAGGLNFNFLPFSLSETVTAAVNDVPNANAGGFLLRACRLARPSARSAGCHCRSRRRPGRDQRWNIGFQQELFPVTALEVDYVGTSGDHQTAAENINLPPAGAGSVQARRPYPRFGNL